MGETIRVFGYFFVPDVGFRSTESSSTLGSSRHHMELVLGLNTMGCGTAIPRLAIRRQSLPSKIPTTRRPERSHDSCVACMLMCACACECES